MKFYKIKHKPTGLFFTPSKGHGNFSVKGKVYTKRPILDYCLKPRVIIRFSYRGPSKREQPLIDFFGFKEDPRSRNDRFNMERKKFKKNQSYDIDQTVETPIEDWEIIEYDGTEISDN